MQSAKGYMIIAKGYMIIAKGHLINAKGYSIIAKGYLITAKGYLLTSVHEVIHAEIFRKLLSAAQKGDLNSTMTADEQNNYVISLYHNFPGLYDYYMKRYTPNWSHNMMASHYRKVIADLIQVFDNYRLSRSIYEDIAWAGLKEWDNHPPTPAWAALPQSDKNRINAAIQNHFHNGPNNCR